jgi:hypothetical protein
VPTAPLAIEVVVMDKVPAGKIVSSRGLVVPVWELESATVNVSVAVPAVVGVPLITPVDDVNDKPAGNVPETDQV